MKTEQPSRLHVGDVILRGGVEHVVWFKNDCRACIAPLASNIQFRFREEDGKPLFLAKDSESISPNSDVKIVRSMGRQGLAVYLEEHNTSNTKTSMAKNKDSKTSKSNAPKLGKLGGYKGHSMTSVIRAFGKAGWSLDEARAFFERNKLSVADATIKIQLRAGRIGEGGDSADFSKKDLEAMRPKNVKPAKKDKAEKPAKKSKKAAKEEVEEEEEDEPEVEEEEEEVETEE